MPDVFSTPPGSAPGPRLTVAVRPGLASDRELAALAPGGAGEAVFVRLLLGPAGSTCHCCAGAGPDLVAVMVGDPGLPISLARALAPLAVGAAVAGRAHEALVGGEVALPGVSVPVAVAADLGAGDDGNIVLPLSRVAAAIAAHPGAASLVRATLAIVASHRRRPRPAAASDTGWNLLAGDAGSISLSGFLSASGELPAPPAVTAA